MANTLSLAALTCGVLIGAGSLAFAASCPNRNALGTSRTLVVDPSEHARLGAMQYRETLPLADREVVLTFDDGPLPPYSTRVLDVLAAECVKATYFLVGGMAKAYPHVVARIAAEGHTIGTHSQNHPMTFHTMTLARAQQEIDGGIASVTTALGGGPPAPFFRFPGLLRASPVERYLASRNLMTWSADIPSDDWRGITDKEIIRRTLERLEAQGRGIVLLHDIKPATALALPKLLRKLKARGYSVVHVVPMSRDRSKTATLPSQWLTHRASRQAAPVETQGAEPEIGARRHTLFETAAGRQDTVGREDAVRAVRSAYPMDHGCRFDQHHGVEDLRPKSVKPHPEEPVGGEEPQSELCALASEAEVKTDLNGVNVQQVEGGD
jgi:peptidoglycan/xylan/chitin deacetylase (PgdA/CDA1 family)